MTKVAIIGSRGIPAKYSGFEVFAEHLAVRLIKKNYSVTVSCEYALHEKNSSYKGVCLDYFPIPAPKNYLLRKSYEILYDVYFIMRTSRSNDIIYLLGIGTSGAFIFLSKLLNRNVKTIINMDGLEWRRAKFNRMEKLLLRINTIMAMFFADNIILDSRALKDSVDAKWIGKTVFIPYGVEIPERISWNINQLQTSSLKSKKEELTKLDKDNFWLVISRIEPENNIHNILRAFLESRSKKYLVVIGDPTSTKYKAKLDEILEGDVDSRVLMVGSIYDNARLLNMLRQNCFSYIHGHSVGGTNPSLLEAMATKNIIVAHDNEFNREVCGNYAFYFKDKDELKTQITLIEQSRDKFLERKNECYGRAKDVYSWESVVNAYCSLFSKIITKE